MVSVLSILDSVDVSSNVLKWLSLKDCSRVFNVNRRTSKLPFESKFSLNHTVNTKLFLKDIHKFEEQYPQLLDKLERAEKQAKKSGDAASLLSIIRKGATSTDKLQVSAHGLNCLRSIKIVSFSAVDTPELDFLRSEYPFYADIRSLGIRMDHRLVSKLNPFTFDDLPRQLIHLTLWLGSSLPPLPPRAFPENLQSLQIDYLHNEMSIQLPPQLKILKVRRCNRKTLKALSLPANSLEELHLEHYGMELLDHQVHDCKSLKILSLPLKFDKPFKSDLFPPSLQELNMGETFNRPLAAAALPNSLKKLTLSKLFHHPILPGALPKNLEQLIFPADSRWNHPIESNILPKSLLRLTMSRDFNHLIPHNILPPNLQILEFGQRFSAPLQHDGFPPSLRVLRLSTMFTQPLKTAQLGHGLTELEVGRYFQQCIGANILPDTLQTFIVKSHKYAQPFNPGVLPATLKRLEIYSAEFPVRCLSMPGVSPPKLYSLTLAVDHFADDDSTTAMQQLSKEPTLLPASVRELTIIRRLGHGEDAALVEPIIKLHPGLQIVWCWYDPQTETLKEITPVRE